MKSNKHAEKYPELHPPSLRSSGSELDEFCPAIEQAAADPRDYGAGEEWRLAGDGPNQHAREGSRPTIEQAEAGTGLDSALRKIDGKK